MTADAPLDGRVALVTGSTGGIGREIARTLAADGARVCLHGRDRQKGERARDAIASDTGADVDADTLPLYTADLADPDAVREFASAVRADHDRLDVLVANAGTWQDDRTLVELPGCPEPVELTFAVNHLGHYLLTHCLVDALADSEADPARVVVVSSAVHRRTELDLDAVCGEDGPSGVDSYGLSKLANVMFTYELARRLPDGVTANCCHPGVSPATDLDRDGSLIGGLGWKLYGLVGRIAGTTDTPAEAAETPTYLARSDEVADVTGAYFEDCKRTQSSEASYDRNAQRTLWEQSGKWVGLDREEWLEN